MLRAFLSRGLGAPGEGSGALFRSLGAAGGTTAAATAAASTAASTPSKQSDVEPAVSENEARSRLAQLKKEIKFGPYFGDFVSGAFNSDTPYYSEVAPTYSESKRQRKPEWMKRKLPQSGRYTEIKAKLRELKLATVCEEARCPNIGECWGGEDGHPATATIMLMGDTCTRGCRFCAVKTKQRPPPLDPDEPKNTAEAVAAMGVEYVVLTSVDRDDVADYGADHIASTIEGLKRETNGRLLVEALVPDFQGDSDCVARVAKSGLDVFAHNVETVPRLQSVVRDRRANWDQSIAVLKMAKEHGAKVTKSSIMLGCGEATDEVVEALRLLRVAGVDVVTLGQYMRPTKRHMEVSEFVTPEAFEAYAEIAREMGFLYVAAGPMVRSSYRAGELYLTNVLRERETREKGADAFSSNLEPMHLEPPDLHPAGFTAVLSDDQYNFKSNW